MIRVINCCLTNTGKVRRINEDSLLVNDMLICRRDMTDPLCNVPSGNTHLYVVADGLGGHSRGDLASRTVLELFKSEADRIHDKESLLMIMRLAKSSLDNLVRDDFSLYGLGTTLAGLLMEEDRGLIFNCGDCRVYRLRRDKSLDRLTRDHSLVQELVDRGEITEEQMRFHPNKNIVTATITGDLLEADPHTYTLDENLRPGERYLICSDGVWENFTTGQMADALSLPSIGEGAKEMTRWILKNGARDNFSLILIEIEDEER